MSEPTWKTQDGRIIRVRDMGQRHLESTIRWLETRGIRGGLMTNEQLAEDPVANAEWRMSEYYRNGFIVGRYKDLLAERERRRAEILATRALMATTRPGSGMAQGRAETGGPGGEPAHQAAEDTKGEHRHSG